MAGQRLSPAACFALFGFCLCQLTQAANPTYYAKEVEFWNGTAFVVVSKIEAVQLAHEETTIEYVVEMTPVACIAGLFNPAAHPTITADMMLNVERRIVPKPGDLVLAVICDREKLGVPRPGFAVRSGRCSFMPNNQPLIVLKGMDDPVILEVLKNMQVARPTTQPAMEER